MHKNQSSAMPQLERFGFFGRFGAIIVNESLVTMLAKRNVTVEDIHLVSAYVMYLMIAFFLAGVAH
jgi:hypothetical protein